MNMIQTLIAAGAFLLLLLTSVGFSQVGPQMTITAESNGLVITGPASSQHFQMRIAGNNVTRKRTTKGYWFTAKGTEFQLFPEENSKFLITDIPYRLDDRAVLKLYQARFMHRNGELKIHSKWLKLASGNSALFWSYNKVVASPRSSTANQREMFLVLAGPGHVFGLFAPVPSGSSEREIRLLLTQVLGTLTFIE
jgi:hypothetical protein